MARAIAEIEGAIDGDYDAETNLKNEGTNVSEEIMEVEVVEAPEHMQDGVKVVQEELETINLGSEEEKRPVLISSKLSLDERKSNCRNGKDSRVKLINERRQKTEVHMSLYQKRVAKAYDKMVRGRIFKEVNALLLITLLGGSVVQVGCLDLYYPTFTTESQQDFSFANDSGVTKEILQLTYNFIGASMLNLSGRIWYKKPFKLWNRRKGSTASFNSTFVLVIDPQTPPGCEGMAFILTRESSIPDNSEGKWLGIVNASTNGSSLRNIVAVEFDTRKSYEEDLDDKHVGVDLNSINSIKQVSMSDYGVNLSSGFDVTARIQYDGESITIFVSMNNGTGSNITNPVISIPLNLSDYLPEDIYMGFSASTGNGTQLNCVKSWHFNGVDIEDESSSDLLWVWITIPVLVVFFITGFTCYLYWRRKHAMDQEDLDMEEEIEGSTLGPQKFRLKELKSATRNFHSKNQLGRGGFGTVYKGIMKEINMEIAVKRVSKDSCQAKKEFVAGVSIISRLRHKNLVKLIGWCYESKELLLVYEFMPKGSLDKLIFSDDQSPMAEAVILSWERRHNIICGLASALDYLHNGCEKRVLHCDVKSSNMMLDSEFNARSGDFGLARTVQHNGDTHHSTKEIAGTPGYMAPECFHTGIASLEADVYGFGVFTLEVACGRRPNNRKNQNTHTNFIVNWVWELYGKEGILDAVDLRLDDNLERSKRNVC
ncbi:hypothetical protein HHK36_017659 [Tetracentron sinense]|uniref:non-specific serine/threonine protein kinase n=1 Tax=Tetracentron sinense TaxID=13715 RepID=A0A835DCT2_TETSI|nr:hypothetical protein HHK36_017659 [Tetracentron sinense]